MLKRIALLWAFAALLCPALTRAQVSMKLTTPVVSSLPGVTTQFFGTITNNTQATVHLNDLTFNLTGTALVPDNNRFFDLVTSTLDPGESYTGLLFEVGVDGATAAANYTGQVTLLGGSAPDVNNVLSIATFRVTVFTSSVSGKIQLEGIVNPVVPLQFQFRPADGSPTFTRTMTLSTAQAFTLTGLPAKKYIVHIKGDRWLAQNVPVDTTNGSVNGLSVALATGDANNDNFCDSTDFGLLIGTYNSDASIANSGYDIHDDFNNDGVIDSTDFGLLIGEFGAAGDS